MRIQYVIERGVLHTTLQGEFCLSEVLEYRARLLADPGYQAGMDTLVDCRAVTSLPDAEHLRALAHDVGTRQLALSQARCAVVTSSDAAYGLIRMYAVYSESAASPVQVRAFRDLESATRWLRAEP